MIFPNTAYTWRVEEFVDPKTMAVLGGRAINIINPTVIFTVDQIKSVFTTSMTINDYIWGGQYKYSGIRPKSYIKSVDFSSHRYCNAIDIKFKDYSTDEVFDYIMANQDEFPYIVRIEDIDHTRTSNGLLGKDWLHIECGLYREENIEVFIP